MFDTMKQQNSAKATIGVIIPSELKQKLERIAKKEHRSLSKQAEFFLRKSVEQVTQHVEQA